MLAKPQRDLLQHHEIRPRVAVADQIGHPAVDRPHQRSARILGLAVPPAPQIHEQRIVLVGLALGGEIGFRLGCFLLGLVGNLARRIEPGLRLLPGRIGSHALSGRLLQILQPIERLRQHLVDAVLLGFGLLQRALRLVALPGQRLKTLPVLVDHGERRPLAGVERADHVLADRGVEPDAGERAESLRLGPPQDGRLLHRRAKRDIVLPLVGARPADRLFDRHHRIAARDHRHPHQVVMRPSSTGILNTVSRVPRRFSPSRMFCTMPLRTLSSRTAS